jgi:23S rRNA (pseudouridine1915-N3)-methyltransferase
MKISVVALGTKMPAWVEQGVAQYQQRMPQKCQFEMVELAAKKRGKNADVARILRDEAQDIQKALPKDSLVIALDRRGKRVDTVMLASKMQEWIDQNQDVAILIGGPEGIDANYLKQVPMCWSLSDLTMAHPLVRVVLAEQIYRAWSIIANLPYHRGD